MKKNLIQYLTLLLCAILLVICISQNNRLEMYRSQMGREMDELKNQLSSAMDNIAEDLRYELEESAQPVENYDVILSDLDFEGRTISMDAFVKLKQWTQDTAVSLIYTAGDEKNITTMVSDGTGTYSAPLEISMEDPEEFRVEAMVTINGVTSTMEIGSYSGISSLLPLYSSGYGWSGPDYRKGVLTMDFELFLEWQYVEPGTVSEPRFLIYVNDELIETRPAQTAGNDSYCIQLLEVECGENDAVRLEFRCEDSFGISYRFPCTEVILEDGVIFDVVSSDEVEFSWIAEAKNCDH